MKTQRNSDVSRLNEPIKNVNRFSELNKQIGKYMWKNKCKHIIEPQ